MDDDDEIQSHPSPASGSPASSPRENGRITVTVAAPAPQPPPAANSLALALPIQQQPRGNNGGGGREDCWSEGATAVLIDAWGERYLELSRGNLKQKHWQEVAEIVSGREDYTKAPKTDIQCKNRIDTVKKKYKSEKAKIAAGGGGATSKWPFFERLEQLIGPTAKIPGVAGTSGVGNSNLQQQKVPLGIPVGIRGGANQYHPQKHQPPPPQQQQQVQLKNQKIQFRRRAPTVDSDSSEREVSSPVSSDSFPPESYERKRPRVMNSNSVKGREGVRKGKGWGSAVRELTQAILKFGEAYEQAESSKLQQVVEMEKQRMKFAKDLELQRMQFFMKTQLEISQLKLGRKGGNSSNHHSSNNNNKHNNNSDSE
ncbi:trihelix transcription factor ASIL2-like [Gastrolobium bilobum]|uniref:trihelix transcription factor ASIL2-like n=1 Tax=Gastrolobium bilobum TaxID=150636 RepID=UPI002AB2CEFD|nr:trihelix transcription factor ASIL2-like [Gastrolobium bilobum]